MQEHLEELFAGRTDSEPDWHEAHEFHHELRPGVVERTPMVSVLIAMHHITVHYLIMHNIFECGAR